MAVFPEKGIRLAGLEVNFPSLEEFYGLNPDTLVYDNKDKELEELIKQLKQDSIRVDQQIRKQLRDSIERAWKKLQYPNNDKTVLYDFFNKLENDKNEKVRIMHFVDSYRVPGEF